jgi:branched-chain amino acid aminotransferase
MGSGGLPNRPSARSFCDEVAADLDVRATVGWGDVAGGGGWGEEAEVLVRDFGAGVSEAAAACLFLVRDGVLATPHRGSDILESITRETVIALARELSIPVEEREVDRSELYIAEEVFLCGTGQELVPVTSIDRLPVGTGVPGAVTKRLQAAYEAVVRGTTDAHPEWRTAV